jgi:hypothetical protein
MFEHDSENVKIGQKIKLPETSDPKKKERKKKGEPCQDRENNSE